MSVRLAFPPYPHPVFDSSPAGRHGLVLCLRRRAGMRAREIAAVLGMGVVAVRSLLEV
jgi:hypothetical protein